MMPRAVHKTRISLRRAGRNAGTSLLEMLVYIPILAVVVNLSLSVFLGASRLSALGSTAMDRMTTVTEVQQKFTRTVREAEAVAPGVGTYRTGPAQLVLEMPPSPDHPDARRYVVFGHITSTKRLGRLEIFEKDGQFTSDAYSRYAFPTRNLRFRYDNDDPAAARLVTLEVDVENARKSKAKPPVTYRFVAALRSSARGEAS